MTGLTSSDKSIIKKKNQNVGFIDKLNHHC